MTNYNPKDWNILAEARHVKFAVNFFDNLAPMYVENHTAMEHFFHHNVSNLARQLMEYEEVNKLKVRNPFGEVK